MPTGIILLLTLLIAGSLAWRWVGPLPGQTLEFLRAASPDHPECLSADWSTWERVKRGWRHWRNFHGRFEVSYRDRRVAYSYAKRFATQYSKAYFVTVLTVEVKGRLPERLDIRYEPNASLKWGESVVLTPATPSGDYKQLAHGAGSAAHFEIQVRSRDAEELAVYRSGRGARLVTAQAELQALRETTWRLKKRRLKAKGQEHPARVLDRFVDLAEAFDGPGDSEPHGE